MQYYFLLLVILSFLVFGLLVRFFILRRKNLPIELFVEALQNENSGDFETAILTYEAALTEVKKKRFNNTLKTKITGKLKLMRTITEYKNGFRSTGR
jgi:hypothetical protein